MRPWLVVVVLVVALADRCDRVHHLEHQVEDLEQRCAPASDLRGMTLEL